MDAETIRRLNAINQRFYAAVAGEFDASRQRAWQGWDRLLLHLKPPIRVLDVGCGNGRFGVFLAQHMGADWLAYHGVDSSPALIERARVALADFAGVNATFEQRDLIEQPLSASSGALPDALPGDFDLVVLFGVLHHIPGADQRVALMRALADRVGAGGLLVFSEWRFADEPRFRDRIVAWDGDLADLADRVEAGDYLLDWRRGTHALRYCHHVDAAEHGRLIAATGLAVVSEYHADAANHYTILQK